MSRDKDYIKLMNSARWVRLRRAVLTRSPLCVRCNSVGVVTPATEVHHRTPVECGHTYAEKERLAYNPINLMPLCHHCHIEIHREMRDRSPEKVKERGNKWVERFLNNLKTD